MARRLCFPGLLALVSGCGDAPPSGISSVPPPPAPAPVFIFLGPADATIAVGGTLHFQPVTRNSVTGWEWSVNDPALATVSPGGLVEARGPGLVRVRACGNNVPHLCGVADLTIVAAPPTGAPAVEVVPEAPLVSIGQSIDFSATASNFAVSGWTWSAVDSVIATITEQGTLTGRRPGSVVVAACAVTTPRYCGTAVVTVH